MNGNLMHISILEMVKDKRECLEENRICREKLREGHSVVNGMNIRHWINVNRRILTVIERELQRRGVAGETISGWERDDERGGLSQAAGLGSAVSVVSLEDISESEGVK
jgi:hypothetical protein